MDNIPFPSFLHGEKSPYVKYKHQFKDELANVNNL